MKITIKPRQHYQAKMSPEELQAHLQMLRNGGMLYRFSFLMRRCEKHKRGY